MPPYDRLAPLNRKYFPGEMAVSDVAENGMFINGLRRANLTEPQIDGVVDTVRRLAGKPGIKTISDARKKLFENPEGLGLPKEETQDLLTLFRDRLSAGNYGRTHRG